jgi:hypothetical protein
MLSHARLRGESNDATDTRGVEYALLQILRCGIIKSSKSANIAGNVDCIRAAEPHTQDLRHSGNRGHIRRFDIANRSKNKNSKSR